MFPHMVDTDIFICLNIDHINFDELAVGVKYGCSDSCLEKDVGTLEIH